MAGSQIIVQERSTIYAAEIHSCYNHGLVEIKYIRRVDGRRCNRKERNLDLNLPPMEVASWWREDEYTTDGEEEGSGAGGE